MGHELIPQGLFLINCFISNTFYASLYTEKYELLKLNSRVINGKGEVGGITKLDAPFKYFNHIEMMK